MEIKRYFVYIATNPTNSVLYTGVTNNLIKRIFQHKHKTVSGFTQRYNVIKLVYFEEYSNIIDVLNREKQIKGGSRQDKINLIKRRNPKFEDIYQELL